MLLLRHDHDAQWFNASAAPAKLSRIVGQHLPGRLLLPTLLDQHIGPSTSQNILYLGPIDPLVGDHHHCPAVTAYYSGEPDLAPRILAPRHPIADIAHCASQVSRGVG